MVLAINYFHRTLHLRCLTGFWIRLCCLFLQDSKYDWICSWTPLANFEQSLCYKWRSGESIMSWEKTADKLSSQKFFQYYEYNIEVFRRGLKPRMKLLQNHFSEKLCRASFVQVPCLFLIFRVLWSRAWLVNGFSFYTTFAKDKLRLLLERFLGSFMDFSVVRLYLLRYDCIHIQLEETD